MRPLQLLSLLLTALAAPGCGLLPGSADWEEATFHDVVVDDVFAVAVVKLDIDYAIRVADRAAGRIETEWDYDSLSPGTRYLQRERVVAEIEPAEDDGVALRLRVQTEVKERLGLLSVDERNDEGWSDGRDDVQRAAFLVQRIRSQLDPGGPSEEFYGRRPLFPGEAGADAERAP